MFPVLVWVYRRLALREEVEVAARFGAAWARYAATTPRFLPSWRHREAADAYPDPSAEDTSPTCRGGHPHRGRSDGPIADQRPVTRTDGGPAALPKELTMSQYLPLILLLLACPVGMALMMWYMGRYQRENVRRNQPERRPAAPAYDAKAAEAAEVVRLRAEIDQLKAAHRDSADKSASPPADRPARKADGSAPKRESSSPQASSSTTVPLPTDGSPNAACAGPSPPHPETPPTLPAPPNRQGNRQ
ncbi:hypothetical protein NLX86_12045 [Streptomyces sp. A3M-1-3]|uniref:methyltransferase family protein n=1 Tax=Streptomyces sp. A3M-1-3 TaxID=2962044 RepID=UPI0020B67687|nr:hypothetical protein [Streptomyces sp. A3M-1-3]MCP3818813.1 hypothetical protein [Streptomyces sp. A3M-1-3]